MAKALLISPAERPTDVDESDVSRLISEEGFRLPTPDETKAAQPSKFSGLDSQIGAGLTAGLRGATVVSDYLLDRAGISSIEETRAREAENLGTSIAAEFGGTLFGLSKFSGPVGGVVKGISALGQKTAGKVGASVGGRYSSKLLSGAAAQGAAGAVEGALYGGARELTDFSLGDPGQTAGTVAAHIGFNGLLGGGIGSVLGGIHGAFKAKWGDQAIKDVATSEAAISSQAMRSGQSATEEAERIIQHGLDKGLPIGESDSRQYMLEARETLNSTDKTINPRGPVFPPIQDWQVNSEINQQAHRDLNFLRERDTKVSRDILLVSDYQRRGWQDELRYMFSVISPEAEKLIPKNFDLSNYTAGSKIEKAIADRFRQINKGLKPEWEKLTAIKTEILNEDKFQPLVDSIREAFNTHTRFIKEIDGKVYLHPWDSTQGITKKTHSALKDFLQGVNRESTNLGGFINARKSLREILDNKNTDGETLRQLGTFYSKSLNFIESIVDTIGTKSGTSLDVRKLFRDYAILSQQKSDIYKIFGGKNDPFTRFNKQIVFEDLIKNIFKNTNTITESRSILGDEIFNEAKAYWLYSKMNEFTDAGGKKFGFSPQRFSSFIRTNKDEWRAAFPEGSGQENYPIKINALTDALRLFPNAFSDNISQSGNVVINSPKAFMNASGAIKEALLGKLGNVIKERKARKMFEDLASGQKYLDQNTVRKYESLGVLEKIKTQVSNYLEKAAKGVANKEFIPYIPALEDVKGHDDYRSKKNEENFQTVSNQILELANNPSFLLNVTENAINPLSGAAPYVSSALARTTAVGAQYLASKLPKAPPETPLGRTYYPSFTERAKFQNIHQVVNQPLTLYKQMKEGNLTPDSVEAVKVVYPELFVMIQNSLISEMVNLKIEKRALTQSQKTVFSMVLGVPVDSSLSPASTGATQQAHEVRRRQKAQTQKAMQAASNRLRTPSQRSQADKLN